MSSMTPPRPYQVYVLSLGTNGKPTGILPVNVDDIAADIKNLSALNQISFANGTVNGVAYLNASKTLTTGSGLTFDGSQFDIPAGTAALPSLSTVTDPNTGLWFPAADTMAFSTNGSERVRIDASGNLGLGVTPSAWSPISSIRVIQNPGGSFWNFSTNNVYVGQNYFWNGTNRVYITNEAATEYNQGSGNHRWLTAPSGIAGANATFTQAMTLTAAGNLGIGTSSPSAKLELSSSSAGSTVEVLRLSNPGAGANTQAQIKFFTAVGNYGTISGGYGASAPQMAFDLPSATPGNYVWQITGAEKMRLDASGNVGVGTTTPGYKLHVSGAAGDIAHFGEGSSGAGITFSNRLAALPTTGANTNIAWLESTSGFNAGSLLLGARPGIGNVVINAGNTGVASMIVTPGGRVGIGTNVPGQTLDIKSGQGTLLVESTTGVNSTQMSVKNTGGTFIHALESSTSTNFGVTPYSAVLWHTGAYPMVFATSGGEKMRLDSSGNLGLGVTPSAWNSAWRGLQISTAGALIGATDNRVGLGSNYAETPTGSRYIVSDWASAYSQVSGSHRWLLAPSGTAGSAISFTQAMTLTTAGNLGIGTTTPTEKLSVVGNITATGTITQQGTPMVVQTDIGTGPNEIPLNQYLGEMAYMNTNAVVIQPQASATPNSIGDMIFQLTDNTTLVVKVKGSDGTVRSATLTLA